MLGFALLLALAQAEPLETAVDAPAAAPATDEELKRRAAAQPAAVRDLIERRAMCNHWAGEEPYDADRRREIEQAITDLSCTTVRAEEIFLRRHFATHPDTVKLLDETSERDGW